MAKLGRKCRRCPHLDSCADYFDIDRYMDGYYYKDMYDPPDTEPHDHVRDFLQTKAYKKCTDEHYQVMHEIDPEGLREHYSK